MNDRNSFPRTATLAAAVVVAFGGMVVFTNTQGKSQMNNPSTPASSSESSNPAAQGASPTTPETLKTATFGSGCFWCTEGVFQLVKGVNTVVSGYSGGRIPNPTYQQVCTGATGHAEVIQITYDPAQITFPELLEVFWQTHDPTTLNRQGNDVGTQYRSVVFYHDEEQKQLAEEYKRKLDESGAFDKPIVTEITAFETFYPAEKYHQNYFNDNPQQPYCQFVVAPKIEKFRKVFHDKLKSE